MSSSGEESAKLPENRLWQPVTMKWMAVVFGLSVVYAVLRYHIAGDVSWSHFPLFILNKATSLAAVMFVACSYLVGRVIRWHNHDPRRKLVVVKFCGLMGFSLALIHAFFSVCLLKPSYFAKFFEADGRLTLACELGMATGVVALWALSIPAITSLPMMPKALGGTRWKRTQRMGYLCLVMVVGHMIFLGLEGWLAPETWPSGMPPISLLAVTAAAIPIVVKVVSLATTSESST